jgi:SAM-dependent methyltransferase
MRTTPLGARRGEYNFAQMGGMVASTARGVPVLDRQEIERKARLEARHWWYRGRRRIVIEQIERLPLRGRLRILDVGCGSGDLLGPLRRFGAVTGVDLNPSAVEFARGRAVGEVRLGGIERLPPGLQEFDLVTCLDVLEHVADDARALAELRRVTAPGGYLVVSAPAYPALWSSHDLAAGHLRRYRRGELSMRGTTAGWRRLDELRFNALLLPFAATFRLVSRAIGSRPRSDLLATPRRLDRALEHPLRAEAAAIRRGWRLPVGLSILAVFQNPAAPG